jgi:signal transduction histidine kinase
MEEDMGRKLWIGDKVEVPWGSHFIFFYELQEYLINLVIHFLQSGLESNEYCLWITNGFNKAKPAQIMRKAIPNFDLYKKKKQIEIISYVDWYVERDLFSPDNVLQKYSKKYSQALANHYDGLRLIADYSWAGSEDLKKVDELELGLNKLLKDNNMLVICSYSFKECSLDYFMHALTNHHLGIIRIGENYDIVETIKINNKILGNEIVTCDKLKEQLIQFHKMEAIGRLSSGVAHDFNNFLMIIMNYCDLLMNKLPSTDPLSDYVRRISKAADQATELASTLLSLGRGQRVESQPININDVIIDSEKVLRSMIGGNVDLILTLHQGLGRVKAAPGKLQQILLNLVLNSLDAMPNGGKITIETADVELSAPHFCRYSNVPPGAYVVLSVSDTGKGIDSEVQSHIFEPFYTTKGEGKGTGLGLANVYAIIKQLRGHIEVKSNVGVGTTFRFYFPQADELIKAQPEVQQDILRPL